MPRSFGQVIVAREDDSFSMRLAGSGTTNTTKTVSSAVDVIFITDVSVSTTGAAQLSIYNGTAFIYGPLDIPANPNPPFVHQFQTPLKCSAGTQCVVEIASADTSTVQVNVSGYVRKLV